MLEGFSRIDFVAKKGKGKIPCYEANEGEKDIVRNRDIDLTNPVGSYEMISFISDLLKERKAIHNYW